MLSFGHTPKLSMYLKPCSSFFVSDFFLPPVHFFNNYIHLRNNAGIIRLGFKGGGREKLLDKYKSALQSKAWVCFTSPPLPSPPLPSLPSPVLFYFLNFCLRELICYHIGEGYYSCPKAATNLFYNKCWSR